MHRLGATLRTPTHAIPLGTTIGATSDPKLGLARAEIHITGGLISMEHYIGPIGLFMGRLKLKTCASSESHSPPL